MWVWFYSSYSWLTELEHQTSPTLVSWTVLKKSEQCGIVIGVQRAKKEKNITKTKQKPEVYPWNSTEYLTVSPWTITGLHIKKCFMLVERIEIFRGAGSEVSSPKSPSKNETKTRNVYEHTGEKKKKNCAKLCFASEILCILTLSFKCLKVFYKEWKPKSKRQST